MYGLPINEHAFFAAIDPGSPKYSCGQATGRSFPVAAPLEP